MELAHVLREVLKRLVDEFAKLTFCHDDIRANHIYLFVATELEKSWELPRSCNNPRLQFLEALCRVSHQVHHFRFNVLVVLLYANIDDVTDLVENITSEALSYHDVIYLFMVPLVALLVDESICKHSLCIQIIWLIANLRMFLHIFEHLSNIFNSIVLAHVQGVCFVLTGIVELHIDRIEDACVNAIEVNTLVSVDTGLLEVD